MSSLQVKVPSLGESVSEATIGTWKRAEGDAVAADEPLVEVESEKATVELPSPGAGVLRRILRKPGDTVAVGEVIAEIEPGAQAAVKPAPAAAAPAAAAPPPAAVPAKAPATTSTSFSATIATATAATPTNGSHADVKASPALRKLMAEKDIAPGDVQPSGPAGRIQREDVLRAAERQSAPAPTTVTAVARPAAPAPVVNLPGVRSERLVPMTPLRKTVARRLLEAQSNAAILTTFNEVNMSAVMELRERFQDSFLKKHGVKLGFMSFFVKAAVDALKAFPLVNAEVRGTDILYKDYYDIGVAVGGGRGLVVPVVRNADQLSFAEIERTIGELATKAKENRLTMQELEGGTFTISNGGIYGSMLSTPILNPPQSGILGLHNIQKRAVVVGDAVLAKPMMYLALSYDHRIIDGREAVQFLVRIKECIEDPERILIEV
jgi:2-oxoglutarate dehydrogenase E2 component (dihydrolipoamide succinyltransferase)